MRVRELLARLHDRWRREQLTADLDDELRFHQAMLERDHRALGASPTEARRRGRLRLGNTASIREETRDMWSLGWIDDVLLDLRYATRVVRHNPGFTAAVVLTLALGIGANTAIFSVVNAVVIRPLPYADPDRLFAIWTVPVQSRSDRNPSSYPDIGDFQAQSKSFTGIGGYAFNRFEIAGPDGAVVARGVTAMPGVYSVLGAQPLLGRLPRADEERLPVIAISYRLWRERFGGDPAIVGRRTIMDEQSYTIVGVMPRGFHFPTPDMDLWMTIFPIASQPQPSPWLTSRGLRGWRVVARLKPGVTAAAAEAEMNTIMHRLGEAFPDENGGTEIKLQSIREHHVGNLERPLWLLLGAAGLVLLLACANVAHLLLARTSTRAREIAVRRALGAHQGRVVQQLLTESMLFGMLGGITGVGLAAVAMRLLLRFSPQDIPRLETVSLDTTSLVFALVVSMATGVLFGVAPALITWGSGAHGGLRSDSRSVGGHGARVRAMLTTAEVAFALLLLVGAGLMIRSFAALLNRDLGLRSERVAIFHVALSGKRYPASSDRIAVIDRVLTRLHAIPGVTSAGASTSMPPARMQQGNGFMIEGDPPPKPGQEPTAIFIPVTPKFLATLGIPLVAGRPFGDGDDAVAPRVVLVNRELQRRYFARRDPVGARLRVEDSVRSIVGVVGDVPYEGPAAPTRPQIYVPWAQNTFGGAWIAVKTALEPQSLSTSIRDALASVDPLMNPRDLQPLDRMIGQTVVRPRFHTWLLSIFGAVALALAALGIYGVVAYGVARRTAEIGLRLALGAPPGTVVGLVLRRGLTPVVFGLAIGLVAALAFSKVMAALLHGISPTDGPTFVAVTTLLATVAAIAAYVPAARAARLDPLRALRSE